MFKSIFSKYFTVMSLIIVVSYAALGGMQVLFSSQYWMDDKRALLQENARNIAQHTASSTVRVGINEAGGTTYQIVDETLTPILHLIASAIDAQVLITDNKGVILLGSDQNADGRTGDKTLSSLVGSLNGGESFTIGNLNGLYTGKYYTAATPIVKNGATLGYVFASSSAAGMGESIRNNLQVFLLSALGVLTLTFIVIYLMTYRMVRPLRQMAAATRAFGNGDFSYRIPVHGKDEIAELATALNAMAVSLSSVEEMRRSFVANVSHELKTPMTTIAGFIDGILDGTIPGEKRNYYLQIVSSEVKRLSRLVKSMLDLSRIDNGELKIHPVHFDLTEVACTALLSFERRIEEKHIQIAGLEDCPRTEVYGDFDLLGQVLYNLLDNAVKFTNEGGVIFISLEKKDGRAYCAVRNSGAGVPSHEMPRLFERFYKSDKSRSLDKNGVGLGLYIVKSVISLHQGEIVVRSVEGEYTEFAFWIPDPEPAEPVKRSADHGKKPG